MTPLGQKKNLLLSFLYPFQNKDKKGEQATRIIREGKLMHLHS